MDHKLILDKRFDREDLIIISKIASKMYFETCVARAGDPAAINDAHQILVEVHEYVGKELARLDERCVELNKLRDEQNLSDGGRVGNV